MFWLVPLLTLEFVAVSSVHPAPRGSTLFSVRRVAVYEVCGCKADWLSSTFRTTLGMQSPSSDYRSGRFLEAVVVTRFMVFRFPFSLTADFLCVTHLGRETLAV